MELKTILNRRHPIPGFVYGTAWSGPDQQINVELRPRKRSRPTRSKCGLKGPTYDTARVARPFDFIPLLGFIVVLWYCMRRVDCCTCGVTVEKVPWAIGKQRACIAYQQFLAFWAKKLAWTDVARTFHTSWKVVYHAVSYVVTWGLEHRNLDGVTAIGIDEIAVWSGHKYLTVVYQINEGMRRLLWVGYGRTTASCTALFRQFGRARSKALEFVSSDMWRACINVVARHGAPCGGDWRRHGCLGDPDVESRSVAGVSLARAQARQPKNDVAFSARGNRLGRRRLDHG